MDERDEQRSPGPSPAEVDSPRTEADVLLEGMAAAGQLVRPTPSFISTQVNKQSISKIRYTHDGMIDLMIANPHARQRELAATCGVSETWLSVIVNSDAFKAQYEKRRAEVLDPILAVTLKERFEALTVRSLEVLQEKLCKPADQVPDMLAVKGAEIGAKALGFGAQAGPTVLVTSEDRLASLAHRLIALRGQPGEIHDVTARELA